MRTKNSQQNSLSPIGSSSGTTVRASGSSAGAIAGSALLLLLSVLLTFLAVEFIFFGSLLSVLPVKTHWNLEDDVRVLAQSSKSSLIPENYIALAGDSFAEGVGDWFDSENLQQRPDYYSGHVLFRKTGRDVITWGAGGAGSLRGFVAEPTLRFRALNSVGRFSLAPPDTILAFFYAGNDLTDNIRDLRLRFDTQYEPEKLTQPDYFNAFLDTVIEGQDSLTDKAGSPAFHEQFYFTRFVFSMSTDLWHRIRFGQSRLQAEVSEATGGWQSGEINKAIINNKRVDLPDKLQGPGMELTQEQFEKALLVTRYSLARLQLNFPTSKIALVLIPSVLSSYQAAASTVSTQTYLDGKAEYTTVALNQRSDEIALELEKICADLDLHFIDSRAALKQASRLQPVHGPNDWKHLNEAGQSALADAIMRQLDLQAK